MIPPRVIILRAPGTNCDHETSHAFSLTGGLPTRVHIRELIENPKRINEFQILCIPGGFSYGDDIASGRIFALEIRSQLGDLLEQFRDRGGLILGICNGFQALLQTRLLMADSHSGLPLASLAFNESGRFVDRWVKLESQPGRCVFLRGVHRLDLPVAHGEGRFVTMDRSTFSSFEAAGQLVLRYANDSSGKSTNPNGSEGDVAGVCDLTGRVFGLMPHPERFVDATQHPSWTRRSDNGGCGAGLVLFQNAVSIFS